MSHTAPFSLVGGGGIQLEIGPFFVRVRSDVDGVADYLEHLYAGFARRDASERHFDIAITGGVGIHRWIRPQAVAVVNGLRPFFPLPAQLGGALVEWSLNWAIGRTAHRYTIVHAAVLERGGRALIMPAPPGSGKSTLCAALAFSGWRLLSDEFAILDPDTRRLRAIPRPISLKEAAIDIIRSRHADVVFGPEGRDMEDTRFAHARPPAESVARAAEPAVPAWILTPRYVPGRSTEIRRMTRATALMGLADQSFNYNFLGDTGFDCLADLVRETECYSLEYSDLDDLLPRLDALAAGRSPF